MDSDLAWVGNGKSGRQSWRYADAFQRSIISEAIYHFTRDDSWTAALYNLATNYAKNYCNRTPIVKVIVENVVTCFLGQSVFDDVHRTGVNHFGRGLMWIDPILMTICAKTIFTFSFIVTLTFWHLVSLVQRYISTKLEISTAFLFWEKPEARGGRTDRQTDGRDATRRERRIIRHYMYWVLGVHSCLYWV